MADPDKFEVLMKMNRLGPSQASSSLPVKFRQVFYDPDKDSVDGVKIREDATDSEISAPVDSHYDLLKGGFFFKDPMCPPDVDFLGKGSKSDTEEESSSSSSGKLGRNMRASKSLMQVKRHKMIHDLMNERKKLLEQQKEQHDLHTKGNDFDQAAAVLVNDLLQNGFQISPPEMTPRRDQREHSSPLLSSADEEGQLIPGEERQLVVAMHKELKRITYSDVSDS